MNSQQSHNIIPIIHRLITNDYGENYWFNGCARYVMEALGEYTKDADLMTEDIFNLKVKDTNLGFWLFAGLTGDIFTQHYKQPFMGDGVNAHHQAQGDGKFFEDVFAKCGYSATFVFSRDLCNNKEMYIQELISYIDKGVPVISLGHEGPPFGVFVGYEEYGKILLYITGNDEEPKRISCDEAMESKAPDISSWIFVGEKKEQKDIAKIYREMIYALPELLKTNNDKYCFGSAAFRAWADDIENGYFDSMKPEEFDPWPMYTNFVCVLATNGSCAHNLLKRMQAHNPDMTFLDTINELYSHMGQIWEKDNGNDLEALGGGFNVTLEVLQDKARRAKIASRIRECGDITDEVVRIIEESRK